MTHHCIPAACPDCSADLAALTYPRCRTCDGAGYVEVEHHLYGLPTCPEPTEPVPCPDCGGAA